MELEVFDSKLLVVDNTSVETFFHVISLKDLVLVEKEHEGVFKIFETPVKDFVVFVKIVN